MGKHTDTANEPVDVAEDDELMDTGILHPSVEDDEE